MPVDYITLLMDSSIWLTKMATKVCISIISINFYIDLPLTVYIMARHYCYTVLLRVNGTAKHSELFI